LIPDWIILWKKMGPDLGHNSVNKESHFIQVIDTAFQPQAQAFDWYLLSPYVSVFYEVSGLIHVECLHHYYLQQ